MVSDWDAALLNTEVSRAAIYSREVFKDDMQRQFVREMIYCQGNWREAAKQLRPTWGNRVALLCAWCEKITRREVRGLLMWNGGAS
jgi:hypothetical protein